MAATALTLTMGLMTSTALAEPVKLRIVSKDFGPSNPDDVAHVERIEAALRAQGTDIDLEMVPISGSNYAENLSLMLLSGDIPDIIYFQGGGHEKMIEQGILEDWRPWLEKMPNLKGGLWPHNVARIDNYPYLLFVFPVRTKSAVVRTDWLDKAGGQVPNTLEEWEALLTAVHTGDFDGDGQNNTLGMVTPDNTDELDALFNVAFGVTQTWMKNEAGEFVHARVSNQERDKLAYYRTLVEKGLFDPEYITTGWELKEDKFYTGRVGVVMGTAGSVINIYRGKMRQLHPDTELTLLNPPKGVDQGMIPIDVSGEIRGYAMSTMSEHKEEVAKLFDFLASPEGQMMERLGFEGREYTKDGDTYTVNEAMDTWYPRFMETTWTPPVATMSPIAYASLEQGVQYYRPDNSFIFPAEYAAEIDATNNLYRSTVYKILSGEMPIDQWDSYVAEWNAAGGTRMTEYARSQLNAQ
ncbi:MAG: extracellular solute-binding protein [Hyphomicrobiales bacterium]|nr:MAG: extracellular solute-binding protein [Hyphomicrobiales bacterium]